MNPMLKAALDVASGGRAMHVGAMVSGDPEQYRAAGELLDEAVAELRRGFDSAQQDAQRSQGELDAWLPIAMRLLPLTQLLANEANEAWAAFARTMRELAARGRA